MTFSKFKMFELRNMAQAAGIKFNFGMTKAALIEALERVNHVPKKVVHEVPPVTERRAHEELRALLKPYTDRGLRIDFPSENVWRFRRADKEDSGHMTSPVHAIIAAAQGVM
jgi:hypothetical protein